MSHTDGVLLIVFCGIGIVVSMVIVWIVAIRAMRQEIGPQRRLLVTAMTCSPGKSRISWRCRLFGHAGQGVTDGYFTCIRCRALVWVRQEYGPNDI